ncbi:MAG: DUF4388 domain-containing protein [Planctomycetota bacterium]
MSSGNNTILVMMPKIARKTLGLQDGTFSHITIEGNALALRGQGVTQPVVLPVSMMGTFHNDLLNNLFLYLSSSRQNGVLGVTTGPLTKAVFFKDGQIVFAGSTDATERIGSILLRLEFVTAAQIAQLEANPDPRRFGVRMCEAGFITKRQLWEALRVQVSGICCSLVHFPVGMFFFVPDCVPPDAFSHFVIEPSEVLFRGMIRLDEHLRNASQGRDAEGELSPLEILSAMERR